MSNIRNEIYKKSWNQMHKKTHIDYTCEVRVIPNNYTILEVEFFYTKNIRERYKKNHSWIGDYFYVPEYYGEDDCDTAIKRWLVRNKHQNPITNRDIKIKKVLDFEIGFPYVNDDGTFSFDKEMSEIHKSIIRRDRKINYDRTLNDYLNTDKFVFVYDEVRKMYLKQGGDFQIPDLKLMKLDGNFLHFKEVDAWCKQ